MVSSCSGIGFAVNNLAKSFDNGQCRALKNISLSITPGLLHGVIGPAGAGKTTLFRVILDLLSFDSGNFEYFLDERPVSFQKIRDVVAYMPEQQSLYADLSVGEHLEFFAELYGLNKTVFHKKSKELLDVTRLGKFLDRPAGKLSGGMYKKLGLMCALLRSPKIMFLDEPTNGVDPISRREFWSILNDAAKQNITVVMSTAYMDEAERCDVVHLLYEGELIASGEPMSLLKSMNVDNFDDFYIKRSEAA